VAIIVALALIKMEPAATSAQRIPLKGAALWRGVLFVRRHHTLRLVILLVGVVSFFALSSSTLLPTFAKDVFLTDERGYSILLTCNGIGALAAASLFAIVGKMRHKGKQLLLGVLAFCLS